MHLFCYFIHFFFNFYPSSIKQTYIISGSMKQADMTEKF